MNNKLILTVLEENNGSLDLKNGSVAVVMAAGHGKRIKSSLPKVMHPVWGVPSVVRVLEAASKGLSSCNQVVVVGKRVEEVVNAIGKAKNRIFAYQSEQLGTGDALRVGMNAIPMNFDGTIFVFPGDMGMLNDEVVTKFVNYFKANAFHMMMLTGRYDGVASENHFGRIVRVPERDETGGLIPAEQVGNVIGILQYQDLYTLKPHTKVKLKHHNKNFVFTREQLLALDEFDSGVFAFRADHLRTYMKQLSSKNVQNEFYLTELVEIYNKENLNVGSFSVENADSLLGFNDKTLWRKIESLHRARVFEKIKNIVDIEDSERFFIHEKVVDALIAADKKEGPLDIFFGANVFIDDGVKLGKNIRIGADSKLCGRVKLHSGVRIGSGVSTETKAGQKIEIKSNTTVAGKNSIKGNVLVDEDVFIAEGVNLTGSDEYHCSIGKNVSLLGSCYIFGSHICSGCIVQSSILVKQKAINKTDEQGKTIEISFVIPSPQGKECLKPL